MLDRIRDRLRPPLAEGFWYPGFRRLIGWIHSHFSLGRRFKRWLAAGDEEAPQGASELYQVLLLALAIGWVALYRDPLLPFLSEPYMRFVGAVIATYFILELFVFSLDWTFVAEKPLESYRRSLATFLVSLIEVAFLFYIVFSLADCYQNDRRPLLGAYENLGAMASLRLVPVLDKPFCSVAAHFERLLAAVLMLIIVASLVGAVIRQQIGDKKIGSET